MFPLRPPLHRSWGAQPQWSGHFPAEHIRQSAGFERLDDLSGVRNARPTFSALRARSVDGSQTKMSFCSLTSVLLYRRSGRPYGLLLESASRRGGVMLETVIGAARLARAN